MNRYYYFDNLKFVLVTLVVIGHALEPLYDSSLAAKTVYNLIYFFHIPLFVFVTGYFSRKLDKLGPFLILYVTFQVLYTLFDYVLNDRAKLDFNFFLPYWLMWYLLAVLLWKLVLPYFTKLRSPILIASCLSVLAGYAATDLGYNLASLRAINFFPYFLAGYYMKKEYLEYLYRPWIRMTAGFILLLTVSMLYGFGQDLNSQWLWGSFSYKDLGHTEWYAGIYRIGAAAVTVVLSVSVLSLIPTGKTRVSEYGTRTIYPYLLHGFIVKYAEHLDIYRHIRTGLDQIILVLLAAALAVMLSMSWIEQSMRFLFRPNLSFLYKEKGSGTTRTR
ncbi:acyltransferase family protein [Paenibacillus harenae]|uniref:acyltransferase family protein n=1 Tax=Paenibacillus harenae TaxID=306543 RepID=UPI0003F983A1|nr:acyltransferase family protein [Paenibacillus harenae]